MNASGPNRATTDKPLQSARVCGPTFTPTQAATSLWRFIERDFANTPVLMRVIFVILVMVLATTWIFTFFGTGHGIDPASFAEVRQGMSESQVIDLLGWQAMSKSVDRENSVFDTGPCHMRVWNGQEYCIMVLFDRNGVIGRLIYPAHLSPSYRAPVTLFETLDSLINPVQKIRE